MALPPLADVGGSSLGSLGVGAEGGRSSSIQSPQVVQIFRATSDRNGFAYLKTTGGI